MNILLNALILYIPEFIGGTIIAIITFLLTRLSERKRNEEVLEQQKINNKNKIEKMKLGYENKIQEQKLGFTNELKLLEKQHELELEKQQHFSQEQYLNGVLTGDYNIEDLTKIIPGLISLSSGLSELDQHFKNQSKTSQTSPRSEID